MKQIKVTQIKGTVRSTDRQKSTLKILRLGRVNRSVIIESTPVTEGQLRVVSHLVKVDPMN